MAGLGSKGLYGGAGSGRNGELAYVNAATGNLVLRDRDDALASHGLDVATVRTYNSLGKLNDDNADNWSMGVYAQQLRLTGTRNTVGSTLVRTDRDGAEALYAWNGSAYVSTAGAGAYDNIVYDTPTSQYVWTDGDSGAQERYDSAVTGRLLSSRDPSGNTLSYAYNAAGLLASVSDGIGEQTLYDYTGNNLTQIRTVYLNAGVSTTLTRVRYAYDTSNRLITVTVDLSPADNSVADAKVYTTSYTYDGTSRRVASVAQSDGTSLSFTYVQVGPDWRVATVKDALNNLTSFAYNTTTRRTTVTDPLLFNTLFDYDALGQLVKVTAPPIGGVSESTSFVYNANGDLTRTVDGEGRAVDMTYDANGNQTLQRDAAGNTVTRSFDARNQLLTETVYATPDPDGAGALLPGLPLTTRYVYDAGAKNLLRFTLTAEGRTTQYIYNSFGERTSAIQYGAAVYDTSALGTTGVPTEAQMTTWVAAQDKTRSIRTDLAYDTRGLLQKTTTYGTVDAAGNGVADTSRSITQYVYDQAGLLLKTISALTGTTLYTYDGLGRQLSATDALNQPTLTQYDDVNGKTRVTLLNGLITTSTYDRGGRLVSVLQGSATVPLLSETKYYYDADSRLRMTQDPTGVRQWMLYDDIGRKVGDVDATGTLTEYSYDKNDRLTRTIVYATAVNTGTLVDGTGNPTNVLLATIRPTANANDQKAWRAYDAAGRLVKTVNVGGAVTELFYDGASRAVKTTAYATAIATAALTATPTAASIAPVANGADRIARSFYDNDGRLLGTLDGEGYLSENQYDAAGQLVVAIRYATVTAAAQQATGTLAQLRPVSAPGDQRTTFLYNDKGQVAGIVDAENFLTEKVYDVDGNLSKVVRYAKVVTAAATPASTLGSIRPVANAEDQVTTWVYDLLDRVSQQTNAEGTQTRFAYDKVGNLVSTTKAYGQPEVRTLNARFDLQGRLVGELTAEGGALLTGGQTQAQIDAIWLQYGVAYKVDAAGRRLSATDQIGNKTLFFYDQDGRLTHTVNALGEVEERQYNTLGQLTATIAYGTRISTAGLSGGLVPAALTTAINAVKNVLLDSKQSYTYNVTGTVASSTDELGNLTTDAYNAFAELTSQVKPLSAGVTRTDTLSYDRRGLQVGSASDTAGINATTSATYDAFGRLVRSLDANNNLSQQSFDRLGRVVQTIDAANVARSSTYDAFDRVLTQTDAFLQVTRYAYVTSTRSVTMTTPEGVVVTTVHTRFGQTQSIKDGKGQTTSYTYDRDGNLLTTVTPLTTTRQSYDKADRLFDTTDARGFKVAYTYDAANRVLTRKVDPTGLNLTTLYAYDAKGQQVSVTDPSLTVTTTSYDLKGRTLQQIVDPAGLNLRTIWTWDARGKVLTVTSPAGTVTTYTYDKLGRRTKEQVDPTGLNVTRSWSYDKNGNAVTATDGAGKVTRYAYDALDRMVYSVDAAGDATRTEYDAEGRVLRVTRFATPLVLTTLPTPATAAQIQALVVASAGKDAIEARRYDKDGRLRFTLDGTGAVTEYKYDANGNVVESIGYANVSTTNPATWTGAADPAVVVDNARDRHVRTAYDQLDRATFVVDGVGGVTGYTYDLNGNVTRKTQFAKTLPSATAPSSPGTDANDRITSYLYDNANREIYCQDASGAITRSDYDADGNVSKTTRYATVYTPGTIPGTIATNAADRITAYSYDKANRLSYVTDAMGYVTRNTYDGVGRVLTTTRYAGAITVGALPTTVPVDATKDRTDTFLYDLAGRLKTSTDALGFHEDYTYDGNGNKLTFSNKKQSVWTYTYDAAGRLASETTPQVTTTSVTGTTTLIEASPLTAGIVTQLQYDGLGNLTSRIEAFGRTEARTTNYFYDAAGRQIKVTYPLVAVYNETTAALATNGSSGLATRAEAAAANLSTYTYYDGLGNAVANVDVAGSTSLKAYDSMGRVSYEVDALGFVTNYGRNAFGESTTVTRYSNVTALTATAPTSAAQAPTAAQVSAVVNAAGINHGADRILTTGYDKLGRVASVLEPQAYTYDADTALGTTAGKQTKNTYNAFGELVQVAVSKTTSVWLNSYSYYDRVGNQVASADALGYLTVRQFDAVGDTTSTTEYATAMTASTWSVSAYAAPVADTTNDRKTDYAYDKLNRKLSETRRLVAFVNPTTGVSAPGDVVTSYGYDAVGNLTKTTDATGASVYSYYDALGRVSAVAAPTRSSTVAGTALTPLTIFKRDAYGNVLVTIARANGATAAAEFTGVSTAAAPGYTSAAADPADRTTVSSFDLFAHTTQTTDAAGYSHYFSYNARGQLAKSWQAVTDNAPTPVTTTLFEAYQYDKLGHLIHTYDPAPPSVAGVTDTGLEYNGFGELVRKGVNGKRQEYFDYDGAGHLWRTNTGDGVSKIFLYDLLGRQTSDIRSAGGIDDRDLSLLSSPDQANILTNARRTDTYYDALGRVVKQVQPQRTDKEGGVRVVRQLNTAAIVKTSVTAGFDESGQQIWGFSNRIDLSWSSLANLGTGDIRVELYYTTAVSNVPDQYDENGNLVSAAHTVPGQAISRNQVLTAEQGAAGASFAWTDADGPIGGVSAVNRLVVYKKNVQGAWQKVIDQNAFGYAGNTVEVAAPADPSTVAVLQMRVAGSTGAYTSYAMVNFGSALRFDASGLALGSYEYIVQTTVTGQGMRTASSGTLTLSEPPLTSIGIPISYGPAGAGILAWQTQGAGMVQTLRYRAAGTSGAWTALTVTARNGSYDGVDTSTLAAGNYDFELLWKRANETANYAHAIGSFTVTAAVAPIPVAQVGYPQIAGIGVGSKLAGSTQINGLYWNAASGTPTFRYKVVGASTWTNLTVTTTSGIGWVNIASLTPASYSFEITYTSGATTAAFGSGTLTINPQGAGHYETQTITVQVPVTVTPPDPAAYLIGYSRPIYSAPIVVGYDESGAPILAAHYAWSGNVVVAVPYTESQIVRYDTVQQPVYGNVTVTPPNPANYITGYTRATYGAPIVVGADESGVPTLAAHYAWSGSYVVAVPYTGTGIIRYDTVQTPVYGNVTVSPPDPANYITGSTRAVYSAPVFVGYDESGTPILGAHYAWSGSVVVGVNYTVSQIIRYDTVQVPVQVIVGYDESGQPIYQTQYQSQQVPVYGNVTVTPPNPANYMTQAPRPTYGAPVVLGYDESGAEILGAHYVRQGNVIVGVPYQQSQIVGYTPTQVPVYGPVTITPPDPAPYMTAGPSPIYGAPVVVGYDESGAAILGAHYAWSGNTIVAVPYSESQVVGYTPVQVPVYGPVTVTPPNPSAYIVTPAKGIYSAPVFVGYDGNGAPILGAHYAWQGNLVVGVPYTVMQPQQQQVQVWVPGTTPPPTTAITTPPYAAGYTIPGVPKQYASVVTTPANSISVSSSGLSLAAVLSQSVTKIDDTVALRPTIVESLDRWGNVLQLNDARNSAWKTLYKYNANNQVISVTGPDASVTLTYYSALGQQVSVKDARGFVNSKSYDSGGNLVKETHADGGVVTYAYSAFGDKLNMIDALGNAPTASPQTRIDHTTSYAYDKLDRLLTTTHGLVNVYTPANLVTPLRTSVVEKYTYDAAGRKLSQTDGIDAHILKYKYDRSGHVIETLQPLGQTVRATFDAMGNKLTETDQNSAVDTWTYDDFGRMKTHKDIGLATTTFLSDFAGQMTRQTNDRTGTLKQDIKYAYDAAGQLTQTQDLTLAKTTTYAYDLAGHHVLERTVQAGVVYQDNHLGYDSMGRLRDVNDGRVHLTMTYDAAGNRTYVNTAVNLATGTDLDANDDIRTGQRYFQYDQMNRQTIVDAVDAAGNLGQQGHQITYDVNGNRTQDKFYGNRVITTTGPTIIVGYDESTGTAIYATGATTYTKTTGTVIEDYRYDAMDRLDSVVRDGVQVDHRFYDAASEVLLTGPNGTLPTAYAAKLNDGQAADAVIGNETRKNTYDNNRRLTHQTVLKSDNKPRNDIDYNSYDAAGNVLQYKLKNNDGTSYTNTYTSTLAKYDGYRETRIAGASTLFQSGTTTKVYDGNGFLVSVADSTKSSNNRTFVNDASGIALLATQNNNIVQRQLVVNGQVMGRYGVGIDEVTPRSGDGDPNFAKLADFSFGYQPINGNYPTAAAGMYAVQSGDTLQSIARGAYGDEQLWYRIAEANGLSGNGDLRVGQTITIPNRVGTVHNGDQSFKPYDPSKITGDTTPNLPSPDKDCGGLGQILLIVVAVVVTVLTYGAALSAFGALGALAPVAAGAVAGAAGALASQVVGNAVGILDGFDWKAVALGALGGAISGGLAGWNPLGGTSAIANTVVRAAIGNALTQGIAVATGLQKSFDWKGVAAAAAGAGVGEALGDTAMVDEVSDELMVVDGQQQRWAGTGAFSSLAGQGVLGQVAATSLKGLATGLTTAVARGGRISPQQIASDAFGNALGEAFAAAATRPSYSAEEMAGDYARENNRFASAAAGSQGSAGGLSAQPAFGTRESTLLAIDNLKKLPDLTAEQLTGLEKLQNDVLQGNRSFNFNVVDDLPGPNGLQARAQYLAGTDSANIHRSVVDVASTTRGAADLFAAQLEETSEWAASIAGLKMANGAGGYVDVGALSGKLGMGEVMGALRAYNRDNLDFAVTLNGSAVRFSTDTASLAAADDALFTMDRVLNNAASGDGPYQSRTMETPTLLGMRDYRYYDVKTGQPRLSEALANWPYGTEAQKQLVCDAMVWGQENPLSSVSGASLKSRAAEVAIAKNDAFFEYQTGTKSNVSYDILSSPPKALMDPNNPNEPLGFPATFFKLAQDYGWNKGTWIRAGVLTTPDVSLLRSPSVSGDISYLTTLTGLVDFKYPGDVPSAKQLINQPLVMGGNSRAVYYLGLDDCGYLGNTEGNRVTDTVRDLLKNPGIYPPPVRPRGPDDNIQPAPSPVQQNQGVGTLPLWMRLLPL